MPNKYLDSVGLAEYTTLIKTALDDKADLASPTLTGTPTAPTPTAGDDSTKIATTEFVQDAIDSEETRADGAYLPLTGGSVTGNLTVSGTITGDVTGDVTGTASGNLPLNGGTMTGTLYFNTGGEARIQNNLSTNDSFVGIYGGGGYTNGAYMTLSGKSRSTNAGDFNIYANDGVNGTKALHGKSDGTLTWNNKNIITSAGGTMTGTINFSSAGSNIKATDDDGYLTFRGGDAGTSASIVLRGNNYTQYNNPGSFSVRATDGNTYISLTGESDGTLTWNGKEVERVQASGSNYIRFVSGLQICWNRVTSVTTSGKAETFPMAFDSAPRLSVATASNAIAIGFASLSTTGCTFKSASGTQAIDYIAIGKWK